MGKKWLIGLIVVAFLYGIPAVAENLLVNPGFEDPVAANNTQLFATPTGWRVIGPFSGRYLYRPVPAGTFPPTEGMQRFMVTSRTVVGQDVEAIEANTVYTFKIDVLPYTYFSNDEGGRISLRVYNGNDNVILAKSEDYRSVAYRIWSSISVSWDSTDYPQFWGKPLTVAMHVTAEGNMFFDNASLEKTASTKKICITRDIPEAFIAVSENGAAYEFDVQLLQAPTTNVSVTVDPNDSQLDVGAGAGAPVSLTFTSSDWNTPKTVTVSAINDDIPEAVALTPIFFSIDSADPAYSTSDPNSPVPDPLLVKVVDNDAVRGELLYNRGFELPKAETEAKGYYQVPDGWVEYVSYAQGYRYNPPSSSSIQPTEGDVRLSILGGSNLIQPVGSLIEANTGYIFAVDRRTTAAAVDWSLKIACYDALDLLDPANLVVLSENRYQSATPAVWERFTITWDSDSAPQYVGRKLAVILTSATDNVILDNTSLKENYIILTETDGATVVSERASLGNTDTYSFVLSRQPASDVTITATPPADAESVDLGAGFGVPVTLTFTAANWQTPQTITVTAIDDLTVEGKTPRNYTISHTASSSDPYFSGSELKNVKVAVSDDDYAMVLFNDVAVLEVNEMGPTSAQYGVYLQIATTAEVTITLDPGTDVTVNPAVLTFTSENWALPQIVTVTAINDADTEISPEIVAIKHAVSSTDAGYAALASTPINVNVSVIDNDFCGNWGFYPADLNKDCYVNLADFQIMASQWLGCTHPGDVNCAELQQ